MQINNILDFDDEASAKAYNFTITAIKEFYAPVRASRSLTETSLTSLGEPATIEL